MSLDGFYISNLPRKIDHPKFTILEKRHHCFGWYISELFEGIIVWRSYTWNFFLSKFWKIKPEFILCRNLKEPPLVLKIILEIEIYDMTTVQVIKNERKIAIPYFFYKVPSMNKKISYKLVSLIMHHGEYFDFLHYVSDVFDANTGIWWQCDDVNITEIIDLLDYDYIR